MFVLRKLTYTQTIAMSFLCVILTGTLLLCLPCAVREGSPNFLDALFTSTSATCVTGLVVVDTATHWTLFGQIVILLMIQIGGLGFMTVITLFSFFLKRQIGLRERKLLMQTAGSIELKGVVRLVRRVLFGTLIFEGLGAVLLSIRFIPKMGVLRGIYNGFFHSVSAFCNAGFDIMGKYKKFSSLTDFDTDVIVNLTIMSLIVIGGLGFIVWNDIYNHKFKFKRYELHSKVVLVTTAVLLVVGTVLFFVFEQKNTLSSYNFFEKWLVSAFQAVTPRTAGMNTVDVASLTDSSSILTTVLMLIGGSPGSTAGGIKTTTLAVLIVAAIASARHNSSVVIFKRRLDENAVRQACSIAVIYFFAVLISTMAICAIEPFAMREVMFEVASAVGTVGLTMGITPSLSVASRIIIALLMYLGRVGGLTLMLVLAEKRTAVPVERPMEKILIG